MMWVTAKPMHFFVWDSTVFRRYVTDVLKPREDDRCTLWRRRGTRLVNWAGGEHLSRQSKYGDRAFTTSSQWVDNWRADTLDTGDGVTIDEIFVANRPPMGQLCRAVLAFRRLAGEGFEILPFFSGIEWDA